MRYIYTFFFQLVCTLLKGMSTQLIDFLVCLHFIIVFLQDIFRLLKFPVQRTLYEGWLPFESWLNNSFMKCQYYALQWRYFQTQTKILITFFRTLDFHFPPTVHFNVWVGSQCDFSLNISWTCLQLASTFVTTLKLLQPWNDILKSGKQLLHKASSFTKEFTLFCLQCQ